MAENLAYVQPSERLELLENIVKDLGRFKPIPVYTDGCFSCGVSHNAGASKHAESCVWRRAVEATKDTQ